MYICIYTCPCLHLMWQQVTIDTQHPFFRAHHRWSYTANQTFTRQPESQFQHQEINLAKKTQEAFRELASTLPILTSYSSKGLKDETGYYRQTFLHWVSGVRGAGSSSSGGVTGILSPGRTKSGGLGGWARWSHRFSQWGSGSLSIRRQRCNLVTGPPFPTPSLPPAGITWR